MPNMFSQDDINLKSYEGMLEFAEVNNIHMIDITENDWFFSRLVRNKKFSSLIFLLITVLAISMSIASYFEHSFYSRDMAVDCIHDLGMWGIIFLDYILLLFSILIFKHFPRIFMQFYLNDVLKNNIDSYNAFLEDWNKVFSNKAYLLVMYALALVSSIYQSVSFIGSSQMIENTWLLIPDTLSLSAAFWISAPFKLLLHILIFSFLFRLVVSCLVLYKFFNKDTIKLNIQILHPDKSGGIGEIGNYSVKLNMLVFSVGLFIVLMFYNNVYLYGAPVFSIMNSLAVLAFIAAAIILVFTPIAAAHKKMNVSKREFLNLINNKFEDENIKLRKTLNSDMKLNTDQIKAITTIQEIYNIADKQPTWPFNYKVIYSFLGSIASPIIVFLINIITKFLINR